MPDARTILRGYFLIAGRQKSPPVTLELADTPEKQAAGLMNRVQLPPNHGMLFAFKEPTRHGFWMKNTYIPLDIAWMDAQGYITDYRRMEPHDETMHRPLSAARYAVELRAGTLPSYGVMLGDRLVIPKR